VQRSKALPLAMRKMTTGPGPGEMREHAEITQRQGRYLLLGPAQPWQRGKQRKHQRLDPQVTCPRGLGVGYTAKSNLNLPIALERICAPVNASIFKCPDRSHWAR